MKKTLYLVIVSLVVQIGFSQQKPDDPTDLIIQNLSKIESLYFKNLNLQDRQAAVKLMNETRSLVVGNQIPKGHQTQYYEFNLLSEETFQSLLKSVQNNISDDDKTELILAIGKKGKITCAQLAQLVALYRFPGDQAELLKAIADNIIDPVNIGMVLQNVSSSIYRDELASFFKNR